MKTKIKQLFLVLAILAMTMQPGFVTAGIPEAVTYLQAQNDDPWVTMALVAAGQSSIPTGHLASVSGNLATDYAKTILALAAVNEDPSTFGNVDFVAQLKTYYDGTQIGDANLLNDDAWAILALASVGEVSSPEATAAKNFLITNQNVNGGWSYSVGAGSDTNDTAAVIMALIEAGVNSSDSVITNAIAYLQSAQNTDGGIGYQVGNDSDSGSDSWIISALYKAGINPTSWDQQGNNPISHLESLQDTDGGFWWVPEGTSEWNNKAMTAFAVIALAGKSYPVGYYQAGGSTPGTYHLRIEGISSTICDTYVTATTALDIVENGASICSYTYNITQESYGLYLRGINGEEAAGLNGWMYFVNDISPPVGAADYSLAEGDEILWYYGEWGWQPTRVSVDKIEMDPGQTVNIMAEYFNGTDWLPLPEANIKVNNEDKTANSLGQLALTIYENGIYQIYTETEEFVRSEKVIITVGDTVSQSVGLQVEINQGGGPGGGTIGGEAIALIVDPNQLDFGTLSPGQSANQNVEITNGGTVDLLVGASVSGDVVFISGIKINQGNYSDYSESLVPAQTETAEVSLTVPESYLASGVKTGELIFWATSQ